MDINSIGSIASVVSLIASIYAVYKVRSLKTFYHRHLVLPFFLRSLRGLSGDTTRAVLNKQGDQLGGLLQKIDAAVERLIEVSDQKMVWRIEDIRASIKSTKTQSKSDLLRESPVIVEKVEALLVNANLFREDDKWKKH